ncbi:GNAT family N-acetyltransferase [Altererythrobacter rubellus]|uniref:GNAT family N-acetyltransferase n=1 Tax=Altererythrobacter rubellus TaxID=2173831 RepID=A0A9Y2B5W3_9SPHN|nr:GNAT family N-acetyltransferase [Altererythrobacter rubellus]WIW94635.1 GNAT family N-acetyltransferase [Altererythrobacter rubellus]
MFHCTERLLLRPAWPEDWQAVYSGIADEGVVRNLARAPWPYSQDDARSFVELPVDPRFPRFLITRSRDAALIGCIGIDMTVGQVELGYWIARQHWGRGYATEAGRGVIEIASTLGYKTLFSSHFLDNPASSKVLSKLGFKPTGRIVNRHSCGRGAEALIAEYSLDLSEQSADWQTAA